MRNVNKRFKNILVIKWHSEVELLFIITYKVLGSSPKMIFCVRDARKRMV